MKRWAGFAVAMLSACAAAAPQQGNFLPEGHGTQPQAAMAQDAVQALLAERPGDAQRWRIQHTADDPFGQHLANNLRKLGHEVAVSASDKEQGEHEVAYVIDAIKGTRMLRVLITVDAVLLARAYSPTPEGSAVPAGPWSRRLP